MADPQPATQAAAGLLASPLGPWIAMLIAPAIAAGYGADQAVERVGATRTQIEAVVSEQVKPLKAEQEAAAADRRRQAQAAEDAAKERRTIADAIAELRGELRALKKGQVEP